MLVEGEKPTVCTVLSSLQLRSVAGSVLSAPMPPGVEARGSVNAGAQRTSLVCQAGHPRPFMSTQRGGKERVVVIPHTGRTRGGRCARQMCPLPLGADQGSGVLDCQRGQHSAGRRAGDSMPRKRTRAARVRGRATAWGWAAGGATGTASSERMGLSHLPRWGKAPRAPVYRRAPREARAL